MTIFNSYVELPEGYPRATSDGNSRVSASCQRHANPAKTPERFLGRQGQESSGLNHDPMKAETILGEC